MNFTKRIVLAALAIGLANNALAGSYYQQSCTARTVTVPCHHDDWHIGLELLFVEASSNEQIYAADSSDFFNGTTTARSFSAYKVSPDQHLGFELEGSMRFGHGADVLMAYEHLHDDQSSSVQRDTGVDITLLAMVDPDFNSNFVTNLTPNSTSGTSSYAGITSPVVSQSEYNLDTFNAEMGQYLDLGVDADIRLHAGLQYAKVEYQKSVAWIKPTLQADNVTTLNVGHLLQGTSDFDGIGLRFGGNGSYHFGGGFAFVGAASASLLFGDMELNGVLTVGNTGTTSSLTHSSDVNDALDGATQTDQVNFNASSDSVLVPSLKGKIGLAYDAIILDGDFVMELGYRGEGFYNAMRFGIVGTNFENFTLHGPYFKIKYIN